MIRRPLLVAAVGAVMLASAPSASATPADDAFLDAVDAVQIYYATEDLIIAVGHAVCDDLAAGFTAEQSVTTLVELTDLRMHQAGALVGAAIAAYCPDFNLPPVVA